MGLEMMASGARELGEQVWLIDMPPHQVRFFGAPQVDHGTRSVLLLKRVRFDRQSKSLRFDADDVVTLNVGTSQEAVVIGGYEADQTQASASPNRVPQAQQAPSYGTGDREFLGMVQRELPPHMHAASTKLLSEVRKKYPGNLKRGRSRNFSESPDNFWYVIVQPRVGDLSITVRGSVKYFEPVADLEIKDDRGNTRFKLTGEQDVDAALKMIFYAKRKM